ncbi:uncharacterized protein G2W53_033082 [Senna tora]|uniref:Uncharacterized protein n=1 Tax=Senna tora TaxID=362788 RepID=A0A834WAQ2_9FABA|nr:uncharacterized protein G2W53_033082 [Senna tora]
MIRLKRPKMTQAHLQYLNREAVRMIVDQVIKAHLMKDGSWR